MTGSSGQWSVPALAIRYLTLAVRRGAGELWGYLERLLACGCSCTDCTSIDGCVGWSMVGATCTLFSAVTGADAEACPDTATDPSGTPWHVHPPLRRCVGFVGLTKF